jgi:hypothetical protein
MPALGPRTDRRVPHTRRDEADRSCVNQFSGREAVNKDHPRDECYSRREADRERDIGSVQHNAAKTEPAGPVQSATRSTPRVMSYLEAGKLRWALMIPVGAEHTAIPRAWPQHRFAFRALEEEHARILGHRGRGLRPAVGTVKSGLRWHLSKLTVVQPCLG